jgi:hypothetical protein
MDMTKFSGGESANFLEVGGNTTADKVAEALYVAESRYPTRDVNLPLPHRREPFPATPGRKKPGIVWHTLVRCADSKRRRV